VSTYVADITDSGALEKAFSSFSAEAGPIQVLVCNAAYFPDGTPLIDGDSDEFWKGFEINVRGNLNVVRAFAPYATSNPTVINIGTVSQHRTNSKQRLKNQVLTVSLI